ncbi:MAG: hypothetical protein DMG16_07080 [Acidobacteria bacterium]|nr:MAG: hypothetical protein DMG16_07080 [Acidobacteriota bacterium]
MQAVQHFEKARRDFEMPHSTSGKQLGDCQAAITIAARQTPIVKLQLQPVIDVRNPHVVPPNS